MSKERKIKSALISVFSKDGLDEIVHKLNDLGVTIYSTGGTQSHIEKLGVEVNAVESLTSYPSILGGRVKTLHPKVFGGILSRREFDGDVLQLEEYEIPEIDLVIVDLYPFEDTVKSRADHKEIIEKIDIGGISLIRAAAKNYNDVVIVSSKKEYSKFSSLLSANNGFTSLEERKYLAKKAFGISSNYDRHIFHYFSDGGDNSVHIDMEKINPLRYGENPHQKGWFAGNLDDLFTQLNGKALSYNNLLDIDAAVMLMKDFINDDPTFAILKHNNACGLSTRSNLSEAYSAALEADSVSAFGGVLIANREIDIETANKINELFCEVVIAPSYSADSIELLKSKKNRIILVQKETIFPDTLVRTCLNGHLVQDKDLSIEAEADFLLKTNRAPSNQQIQDLCFANKLVKHTKSNTIVLAKNNQLLASGTGQTSRVDALNQAIHKAKSFGFDLKDSVMASDAFFPFPDCVEIAGNEGVNAVVQPGGSIKDKLSIDYCNENQIAMVFTGKRHFKH